MLDRDSPAACKAVYEIGRTLAEHMARTDEAIAAVMARLDKANSGDPKDMDVFCDRLISDWSF